MYKIFASIGIIIRLSIHTVFWRSVSFEVKQCIIPHSQKTSNINKMAAAIAKSANIMVKGKVCVFIFVVFEHKTFKYYL